MGGAGGPSQSESLRLTRIGWVFYLLVLLFAVSMVRTASVYWLSVVSGIAQLLLVMLGVKAGVDTDWTKRHRILVLLATFALGAIAFVTATVSVKRATDESATAQKKLDQTLASLGDTGRQSRDLTIEIARMQRLNTELQERLLKLSQEHGALARATIQSVTGGDSYAYVTLRFTEVPLEDRHRNSAIMYLTHRGDTPLYDVTLQLFDGIAPEGDARPRTPFSMKKRFEVLLPGSGGILTNDSTEGFEFVSATSPREVLNADYIYFAVHFAARNGYWRQPVTMRKINGRWLAATMVIKRKGKKDVRVWQSIDPGFPRDADGKVRW